MPRRRRRHRTDLSGQRKTVVLQTGYGESPLDELNPHMLVEDVGSRVMPLGTRWSEREFAVELVPPSERFAELISDALNPGDRDGLTDAACEFVRETSQIAMRRGRAIYEVVYLRDEADAIAGLEFGYVPPASIVQHGDSYIQHVPSELAEQWEVPTEIRGPMSDLMIFEPPIQAAALRRMLIALAEVGRPMLPDFVEREMRGEETVGYSSTEDIRFRDLALAELTRDLGWDMRAMFSGRETFLEYYTTVRRLRFERFLARFRNGVIGQLNAYLVDIGKAVGETGQLVLRGLPTEADVDAAEVSLQRGDKDFKDLLAPFSIG
jgi:hypothetical protein